MNKQIPKKHLIISLGLIVVSMIVLVVAVASRPTMKRKEISEEKLVLTTTTTITTPVVPMVRCHGIVRPIKSWQAIPEVSGRIKSINPELKSGAMLKKHTLLVEIDPLDYQLALHKLEAQNSSVLAEFAELEGRATNLSASLKIEEEGEKLTADDVQRQTTLLAQKSTSPANLDQIRRQHLLQQQKVLSLKNEINLIPHKRRLLNSKLELHKAQLSEARRNLDRCQIKLPFNGRINECTLSKGQFVSKGIPLFVVDTIDKIEVRAQLAPSDLKKLLSENKFKKSTSPFETLNLQTMGISAEVILHFPDHQVRWPADPIQLSSGLNPTTRTIGLILEVNKPWENIIPGEHPPLLSGMYLEVILRGRQTQNKIVIPRCALRGNEVLTLNKESRLERQTITIQLLQEDIAIVENLAHPTTIILNPPTFALPNTLVEGIINSQISEGCRKRALGIEAK